MTREVLHAARLLHRATSAPTPEADAEVREARSILDDARTIIDRATGFAWTVVGDGTAKDTDDAGNELTVPTVTLRHRGTGRLVVYRADQFEEFSAGCITRERLERKLRDTRSQERGR